MSRKIIIEPVTRIEGHAKVSVHLAEDGSVERARFHVNEFRGFEKFCEGRPFHEMPLITERICGICPVSHHLASAKACDAILGVEPPRPATLLRRLMHMGQIIQSHSMHVFELAGPDLLLGFDAPPETRNVVGLYQANPDLARKAIALRRYGQEIIAAVGDRRIHPNFAIPGGVNQALSSPDRDMLLRDIPTMIGYVRDGLGVLKGWMDDHAEDLSRFAVFASPYLGMVRPDDAVEFYDGPLRLVDADRSLIERFDGRDYLQKIAEHVEDSSYLKFPYYRPRGFPDGCYRVGPLGRLNAATHIATPLAQAEYVQFQARGGGGTVQGTLYYHLARLIEDLHALEEAQVLLEDAEILSTELRTSGKVSRREGIGVLEAPRGTLWHHYWVDEHGILERVNFIVATGNNNFAMSRAVEEVAKTYVDGKNLREGALNRIEAAIRAYDPCLSCSTHAVGKMPIRLHIFACDGTETLIDRS